MMESADTGLLSKFLTNKVMCFFLCFTLIVVSLYAINLYVQERKLNALHHPEGAPLNHREALSINQTRLENEMASLQDYLIFRQQHSEQQLKALLQEQVEQAHASASYLYQHFQSELPDSKLRSLIKESLRHWRFRGGRGYLFVNDMDGRVVLMPANPDLEGQLSIDRQDDTGSFLMQRILDAVKNPEGEGFAEYRWYMPNQSTDMYDKVSFVKHFEPYGWVIGAGDYTHLAEVDAQQAVLDRISSIRIGAKGAVTVLDNGGNILASPLLEASSLPIHLSKIQNDSLQSLIKSVLGLAAQGGGFSEYVWVDTDEVADLSAMTPKLSYIENAKVWDWVLVTDLSPLDESVIHKVFGVYSDSWQIVCLVLVLLCVVLMVLFKLSLHWSQGWQKNSVDTSHDALTTIDSDVANRVFDSLSEGILVTDASNHIVAVNSAFTKLTGFEQKDLLGKQPKVLASGKQSVDFYRTMWSSLVIFDQWQGNVWNRSKQGEVYLQPLAITVLRDSNQKIKNYIATYSDRSEHLMVEEQLRYLTKYDELTGLANRRLLRDRVAHCVMQAERDKAKQFALIFIDIDRFKNINDSLGHGVGDVLLSKVAARLKEMVREVDSVARIGGDEFAVLLAARRDEAETAAIHFAERLLVVLAEPIYSDEHELRITSSIGISVYPEGGSDADMLFRNADTALYHAKSEGRNNYQCYTAGMNEKASSRLKVEYGLRQALEKQAFYLVYQPQFALGGGQLVGCEALIRWEHEDRTMPLEEFIPLAEEVGLIQGIGDWVLNEACRQGAQWLAAGLALPSIAINVSGVQFKESLLNTVTDALVSTGFPGGKLVLELTESALMVDTNKTERMLQELKKIGVSIALDDFGTGYSSLAYLKKFPIDKLKIDRTFIDGLPCDKDDRAITGSILDVSRHLRLQTIAEGVETEEQAAYLQENGCDIAQGFLYSKPLSVSEFESIIKSSNVI